MDDHVRPVRLDGFAVTRCFLTHHLRADDQVAERNVFLARLAKLRGGK